MLMDEGDVQDGFDEGEINQGDIVIVRVDNSVYAAAHLALTHPGTRVKKGQSRGRRAPLHYVRRRCRPHDCKQECCGEQGQI